MTQEVAKWADKHMFEAEKSTASDGPKAYLLGGPVDPLGQIAACAFMYTGRVIRDLADITDEERKDALKQIQATVLKMPLEAVSLHFMLEGVHRGITHQMVRQRTAAYAQESTRFAVKRDMKEATALPPSLEKTMSLQDALDRENFERLESGLDSLPYTELEPIVWRAASDLQKQRFEWDEMVDRISEGYNKLIDSGMAAEEARGIMPTNITTRLNYITNLRSFFETIAVRVSDQAQFEWRKVAGAYALAMREYGAKNSYWSSITDKEYESRERDTSILERKFMGYGKVLIRQSSEWQYRALTAEMKPIEFKIGGPAFGADFDRPSRIGERVKAFHDKGVPSSEWLNGSPTYGIPPIHPDEWLLDPNSARLDSSQEFDIFGNRVPLGTGWHYDAESRMIVRGEYDAVNDLFEEGRRWPRDFENAEEV